MRREVFVTKFIYDTLYLICYTEHDKLQQESSKPENLKMTPISSIEI